MTPATLGRYLIGNRRAIRQIAEDPRSLWIGLAFVFSAALARDYDREDLLHEPWRVGIPLAASLLASLVFYGAIWLSVGRPASLPFAKGYRAFLSLFWMTAPLAWLYAVPYEQFLDPDDALRANLWTLGLVAVWRVALIIRAVQVWLGLDRRIAPVVLLCADALALLAVSFFPWPIVEFMGGITPPPPTAVNILSGIKVMIVLAGTPAFIVLLFLWWAKPPRLAEPGESATVDPAPTTLEPVWSLVVCAAFSIAAGFAVLPITQPPQQLRRRVEIGMAQGRIHEMLAMLADQPREALPRDWTIPPLWNRIERSPRPFMTALMAAQKGEGPAWAREIYQERCVGYLEYQNLYANLSDDEFLEIARFVAQKPQMLSERGWPRGMARHWIANRLKTAPEEAVELLGPLVEHEMPQPASMTAPSGP